MYVSVYLYLYLYLYLSLSLLPFLSPSLSLPLPPSPPLPLSQVSLELFLASYVATSDALGDSDPLPNTKSFRQCFYNFFIDLRGERITTELNGFLRAYNLTMRYVRALKMIENVIEGILDLPLTDQCQSALMKMTYCSQCAGYNGDFLPCQGLCMNTLRGCLVDFADLVGPFQATSSALVEMNRILESYNPWDQITTLNPYFIRMATDTQRDFTNIRNNVSSECVRKGCICKHVLSYPFSLKTRVVNGLMFNFSIPYIPQKF